jgi:hypothetical protein
MSGDSFEFEWTKYRSPRSLATGHCREAFRGDEVNRQLNLQFYRIAGV